MNVIMPPSPGSVSDAFAVLRLVQDPKAAADVLQQLSTATQKHADALASIVGKKDALDAREKELSDREAAHQKASEALASREAAVAANEAEASAAVRDAKAMKSALQTSVDQHARRLAELTAYEQTLSKKRDELEAASKARSTALDQREIGIGDKQKKLDEREGKLRLILAG